MSVLRYKAAVASGVIVFVAAAALGADHFTSAQGDWPQWRGGPQQTGSQSLAGAISDPRVIGSVRLGGWIAPYQILASKPPADFIILAPPGQMLCYRRNGAKVWSRAYDADPVLIGLFDLDGDGRLEVLATTREPSGGSLDLFDAASGLWLWSSAIEQGGTGAVEIADLDADGTEDILWAPAATSVVRAYSFAGSLTDPRTLWQQTLPDYTSDPYSYSPVAIANIFGDGSPEVIIAGGRGQVSLWFLNGRNGQILQRTDYFNDPDAGRTTEGGGLQQLLDVRDTDGDGTREIVLVGAHGSSATYMFQGAAVIKPTRAAAATIHDSHPVGLKYVDGSVQDFDGDGVDDLLVSVFDPTISSHVLSLLDTRTLSVTMQAVGLALAAVITPDDGSQPIIIAHENLRQEIAYAASNFTGLQVGDGVFEKLSWKVSSATVALAERPYDQNPAAANVGSRPVTVDIDGNGRRDVVFIVDEQTKKYLIAVDPLSGQILKSFDPSPGDGFRTVFSAASDPDTIFIAVNSGTIFIARQDLSITGSIQIGGYFRLQNSNGHNNEVAVIADADSDGVNEIYANTAHFRLFRIDVTGSVVRSRLYRSSFGTQEPLVLTGANPSFLIRTCLNVPAGSLCRLNADGSTIWAASSSSFVPASISPVAMNIGSDKLSGRQIVFATGSSLYPMPVYALDSATGKLLWTSPAGPYWDAALGVADFDRDGIDDVALNFSVEKGRLLSGRDGRVLCNAAAPLQYGELGYVDYNGVPIIIDLEGDGVAEILIAEDNAHMTMLEPCTTSGMSETQVLWAAEQASLDDERLSMPALAEFGEGEALIGTGTKRGVLVARNASTGATMWNLPLWNGSTAIPIRSNGLSSVLAVDVDGVDGSDFVVGAEDGWLYAVNAAAGRLVWSINLGAAVGDPIAGDVDGDGKSEIVVPAADGYLYIIDSAPPRRRAAR